MIQKLRLFIAILVLILCGTAIGKTMPQIERQLDNWQILPRQQAMTELYVTEGKSLATTYTPGQNHDVLFTVHNLEGETKVYKYTVSITDTSGLVHPLRNGTFQLSQDQVRHNIVPITPDDFGPRVKVDIQLSNGTQIHYWLDRK